MHDCVRNSHALYLDGATEFTTVLDDDVDLYILLIVYGPIVSMAYLAQTRLLCDYDDMGICGGGGVKDNIHPARLKFEGLRTDPILHRCMLSCLSPLLFSCCLIILQYRGC